ncbi:glycoside hydrolase family 30 beta sandwich domain-containing protein [Streptomyces chattanoogensis]|uniref:glycoside hydrolase family 30 protein n=1 Tax=Streptomyces chattanoogensis TaxID=66876 RepID=UPI00099D8DF4
MRSRTAFRTAFRTVSRTVFRTVSRIGPLVGSRPGIRGVRRALTGTAGAAATALALVYTAVGPPVGHGSTDRERGRPQPRPRIQVHLTTTSDPGGRHVAKGLAKQPPLTFTPRGGTRRADGGSVDITVDDAKAYQTFEGGGASFTDTAAWLLKGSGALSDAARAATMKRLFDPDDGIGLAFLRNPMGASDLARFGYTYDDLPAGRTDPGLKRFTIGHDLAGVLPLTAEARRLNPALKVMAAPWSAPAWMKDNGRLDQGRLQAKYYAAYARYFVKYLRAYQDHGVPVAYVSVQNEPTCCIGYPSMRWNSSGLARFTKDHLLPALRNARLSTKVLALDWNWDRYADFAAPTVDDPAIRNHPNFGGLAWHGYAGDVTEQTRVHHRYPGLAAYDTEHSGGRWIPNQQREDMRNLIAYTRNWGSSWVKWSLAVDRNGGPHQGGCDNCTGLITVHHGNGAQGAVDYTVEYYTMGHLTKFVRPGARRIDSTASATVPNVAWKNPDGSLALIAYNDTAATRHLTIDWHGRKAGYRLPAGASATFTWQRAT